MIIQEEPKIPFKKIFWPALVAVGIALMLGVVFFFLVLGGIIGAISNLGPEPYGVESGSVLRINLRGQIQEKSSSEFNTSTFMYNEATGLSDILFALKKAETDENIKGIYLDIDGVNAGVSSVRSIRKAIEDFKKNSKKFVIAYLQGEAISQAEYYLASAATECYAFPTSTFMLTGLGSEALFFKKLLDKLEVEVQVVRGENNDFKSAVEPFFLSELSDSARFQNQTLLNSMWNQLAEDIAKSRGVKKDSLNAWIDRMAIVKPQQALSAKLIDGLMYKDEMMKKIANAVSVSNEEEIAWADFDEYAKNGFYENQILVQANSPSVAVIIGEGEVTVDGDALSSQKLVKWFRRVRENEDIKAVVFRINSPGGSALASEEIWREVMLTQKVKKVFVSMGDVAASGGYYIATPAERIFAEATTITGSIGVFGMIPYTGKMLENKLGITFDRVQTHEHSGIMSINRKLSPEELNVVQIGVNEIYSQFLNRVAEGRKLSVKRVNQIARGRVWTGIDAQKIGLVDQLATLPEVIEYAKKAINDQDAEVIYYPRVKEDKLGSLIKLIDAADEEEEDETELQIKQAELPKSLVYWYDQIKQVENKMGIQMRMPYDLVFRF